MGVPGMEMCDEEMKRPPNFSICQRRGRPEVWSISRFEVVGYDKIVRYMCIGLMKWCSDWKVDATNCQAIVLRAILVFRQPSFTTFSTALAE